MSWLCLWCTYCAEVFVGCRIWVLKPTTYIGRQLHVLFELELFLMIVFLQSLTSFTVLYTSSYNIIYVDIALELIKINQYKSASSATKTIVWQMYRYFVVYLDKYPNTLYIIIIARSIFFKISFTQYFFDYLLYLRSFSFCIKHVLVISIIVNVHVWYGNHHVEKNTCNFCT